MSDSERLRRFEQRVAGMLRADAVDTQSATTEKLARVRRLALDAAADAPRHQGRRWLAPAGTVAAAALISLLLIGRDVRQAGTEAEGTPLTMLDMDLLVDADAWELVQEPDLEFIEWAAEIARQEGAGR